MCFSCLLRRWWVEHFGVGVALTPSHGCLLWPLLASMRPTAYQSGAITSGPPTSGYTRSWILFMYSRQKYCTQYIHVSPKLINLSTASFFKQGIYY